MSYSRREGEQGAEKRQEQLSPYDSIPYSRSWYLETVTKDLLLGSKAPSQNHQAAGSPGRTCRMGTKRPPAESAPRLALAPHLSQEGNWGGCALQLHKFSLWRGATGQGEQAASLQRRVACSSTKAPGRASSVGASLSFSPWRGNPSPSWPLGSLHPPTPAAVSPVFAKNRREEREARAVDRKGKESAGLKALGSQLGSAGNPGFPGLRLPGRPQRGERGRGEESVAFLVTERWGH